MTRRTITWNTGCPYTREGQVITIQVRESGDLIFNDHSRGIDGCMKPPVSGHLNQRDDERLKDWFMFRYLRNDYAYDRTGEAARLERHIANNVESLKSYVTPDDLLVSRGDFLRLVRDRITEDLGEAQDQTVNGRLLNALKTLAEVAEVALQGCSSRHVVALGTEIARAHAAIENVETPSPLPVQVDHDTLVSTVQAVVNGVRALQDKMNDVDHDGADAVAPDGDDYNTVLAEMTPLFAMFPRKPEESSRWP